MSNSRDVLKMAEFQPEWHGKIISKLEERLKNPSEGTPYRLALSRFEEHLRSGKFAPKQGKTLADQLLSHFGPGSGHHDPVLHKILNAHKFALMTDAEIGIDPGGLVQTEIARRRGGIRKTWPRRPGRKR